MKINRKIKYLLPLLPLCYLFLHRPFPKTIFNISELDIFYLNERRSNYPNQTVARIFENKVALIAYQYQKNVFDGLDLNLYFFASHPRERPGIAEKERFSWLFLPMFLSGVYYQVKRRQYWALFYFISTLFFCSFFVNIDKYLFLLYPFFISSILLGGYYIYQKCFIFLKDISRC